ncbi:hypothetical protein P168DRAFT_281738 [Aspergillus campestris IBT 28561]|uniref:Uncharacterized protein n=1 Tax=Aspergillus campestris (strain IBT 28561) TaxID=1392248 RepID=A0A2I1D2J5_ASPC2|nr:uncharacterized protein P168DRAFT_281738 [Aspergillus campestris IBT 28561]PKY04087.1 hypothetical protein P168DRAFT_281738 [Aspergillus campestris IBT 28561]
MPCGLSFPPAKRPMSDFKYIDQPLSYKLAMEVGELLRQAQIPHILWGEKMFDLLLLNSNVGTLDFVIPDHQMDNAIHVLRDAEFQDEIETLQNKNCRWLKDKQESIRPVQPWPSHWFHLDPEPACNDTYCQSHCGRSVRLYLRCHADLVLHRKSDCLWSLPGFTLDDPHYDDPNYMLANDRRLPESEPGDLGRVSKPNCRLQILTPARYIESIITLRARDWLTTDQGEHWYKILLRIFNTHKNRPIPGRCALLGPTLLREPFQKWWTLFLKDVPPYDYDLVVAHLREIEAGFVELREALIKDSDLPKTPFTWALRSV